jgi:hypothetical protein
MEVEDERTLPDSIGIDRLEVWQGEPSVLPASR